MNLIVGLGNPGKKYANNRHNLGYMVLDRMAIDQGDRWERAKDFLSIFSVTRPYMLVKPTTFVNQSGQVVREIATERGVEPGDILIVHDELDLPFGKIRLFFGGFFAGHHGVESIIKALGTADFVRLRIGIGHPSRKASADAKALVDRSDGKLADSKKHVLSDFSEAEKEQLPKIIAKCQEAVRSYLDEGIEATMNRFN